MKLTKEECYKALRYITNLYEELYITRLKESGNHIDDTKEYWILEELINEHFDNSPLKFEELKEGMWVFDNIITKRYMKIYDISYSDKSFNVNGEWCGDDLFLESFAFQENRFFRKQVE